MMFTINPGLIKYVGDCIAQGLVAGICGQTYGLIYSFDKCLLTVIEGKTLHYMKGNSAVHKGSGSCLQAARSLMGESTRIRHCRAG